MIVSDGDTDLAENWTERGIQRQEVGKDRGGPLTEGQPPGTHLVALPLQEPPHASVKAARGRGP